MSDETATLDAPETPVAVVPETPTPTPPEGSEQTPAPEKEQPWKRQTVPLKALQEERELRRSLREERDFYKAQLEASKAGGQQAPEQTRQADLSKPLNPNDFQSAEEFAFALEERATNKALARFRQETQGASQDQAIEKAAGEYSNRIHSAVDRHPDIVERAQYLEEVAKDRIHPDIGLELVSSPHAADLVVELTNNPDALRAIMDPSPIRAAKALAMLENRVSSQTAPAPKPAIPLTKTVSGASAATKTPAEMSDAEWYAARGFKG